MLPRGNSRNKILTEDLNRKGNQQRKKGQLNKAIQTFDKALANDPNSAEVWNNKAFVFQDKGLFEESLSCFDKALQCDPRSKVVWNNKGGVYLDEGLFDDAITCFEEALKIDPKFEVAWNNKGVGHREKGNHDEAIACHDRAIQLNPHYHQSWNNKGRCAHALGKPAEAIRCYDMAITINGKYTTGWLNKGLVLLDERRFLEAITCFDKVFSLDTTNARSMFYKGCSYRHLEKYSKAVVAFDKAILADPRYSEAYHHKGDTLADQGKYTKALQTFQRALEMDPEDSYSRQRKQQLETFIAKLQQQQQTDTPSTPKLDDSSLKSRSVTLQIIPNINNDNGKKNVVGITSDQAEKKRKIKRALSQGSPLNSSVLFDRRYNTISASSGPSPRRIPGPMRAGRSASVSASVPRPRRAVSKPPALSTRLGKESRRMEIAEFSGEALVVVAAPNGGEYLSAVLPSTHPLVVDLRRGLEQVSAYTVAKAEVIINQVHEEDFKERLEKGKGRPSDWAMDYIDDEQNETRRRVLMDVLNPENSYMIENEHEIPLARLFYTTSLNDGQNICANGFTSNSFDKTGRFGSGIYLTENLNHCFIKESNFTTCLMIIDALLFNKFAIIHSDAPHGTPVEDFRFYSSLPYKNAMTHIAPVVEYAPSDYRPPQNHLSNIKATEFVFFDEGNLIPRVLVHLKKKKKKKPEKSEKAEKGEESEEEKFMKRTRRSTKSEEEGHERESKDRKPKKGNTPDMGMPLRSRSANSTPEKSRITHSKKTPTKDKITVPITTTSTTTTTPLTASTTIIPLTTTTTTTPLTTTTTTAPLTASTTIVPLTTTTTTAPLTSTTTAPLTNTTATTAPLTTTTAPLTATTITAPLTTTTITTPPTATTTAPPTGNPALKVELKLDRPDNSWDTEHVVSWLGTLNLSEDYASMIRSHAIDGEVLVTMTSNDDWKDLGMTKFGDIRKCLKALQ